MTAPSEGLTVIDPAFIARDDDLEHELARFEAQERKRLGLDGTRGTAQWTENLQTIFTARQRATTTILVSGLTMAHDHFVQHALQGIGYRVRALDVPDTDALRFGKEFGNRGQCNPTYFTVGNLVKFLTYLRDEQGMPTEKIVSDYLFLTAGACGPCRFGSYITEYRKALRDAGFEGFRVMLFQQTGGLSQATGDGVGLEMNLPFFVGIIKALMIGDVLNALMYRVRPFEVNAGETDRVVEECKALIAKALETRKGLLKAMIATRRKFAAIEVDRTRVRPKVAIIGEFWAMTTEGDGNYKLQRFLEEEGAEVDIQLVTAWLLYMLWEGRWDTRRRWDLKRDDGGKYGMEGIDPWKQIITLDSADKLIRVLFQTFAHIMGLNGYHLPDMDEIADLAHQHYDNAARGGEGHMEVGKLIQNVVNNKVTMTLSVKPFGCMPSSGVSDGVQALVTSLHPDAIFLPIETSGDSAVNVQSRVQMMLFKARRVAEKELEKALADTGLDLETARKLLAGDKRLRNPLFKAPHVGGSTAADMVHAAAARMRGNGMTRRLRTLAERTPGLNRLAARFA